MTQVRPDRFATLATQSTIKARRVLARSRAPIEIPAADETSTEGLPIVAIRLRQFIAPAVFLLPAILLFGKLLFTPVIETDRHRTPLVRGWPWVAWESYEVRIGNSSTTTRTFFPWQLAADIAVLLGALAAYGCVLAWHRWRNKAWLRFSLRGLMGLTALVAAGLAGGQIKGTSGSRSSRFFCASTQSSWFAKPGISNRNGYGGFGRTRIYRFSAALPGSASVAIHPESMTKRSRQSAS
jgi:hypothetical protein